MSASALFTERVAARVGLTGKASAAQILAAVDARIAANRTRAAAAASWTSQDDADYRALFGDER